MKRKSYVLLCFTMISLFGFGQDCNFAALSKIQQKNIDSIEMQHPNLKGIPQKYSVPIIIALLYFPELKDINLRFKEVKIRTTLNTRPTLSSLLFNSRIHRKYVIRINSSTKDSTITLEKIPYDALIGLFGHEFSHIADYNNRNIGRVIIRLFAYFNKKAKEKFEKEIDYTTIKKGLGCPLYQWSYFVLYKSNASYKYKKYKRNFYLNPEEIEKYDKSLNNRK